MLTTLDIKAELTRRGYTAARLARELGCHRSTVTRVINGVYPYPRILVELARIIGVPVAELAPGRATPHTPEHNGNAVAEAIFDCTVNPPLQVDGGAC